MAMLQRGIAQRTKRDGVGNAAEMKERESLTHCDIWCERCCRDEEEGEPHTLGEMVWQYCRDVGEGVPEMLGEILLLLVAKSLRLIK